MTVLVVVSSSDAMVVVELLTTHYSAIKSALVLGGAVKPIFLIFLGNLELEWSSDYYETANNCQNLEFYVQQAKLSEVTRTLTKRPSTISTANYRGPNVMPTA